MCFVGLNATWWGASFIVAKGPLLKDGVVLAQESIHELWRSIRVSTCFVKRPQVQCCLEPGDVAARSRPFFTCSLEMMLWNCWQTRGSCKRQRGPDFFLGLQPGARSASVEQCIGFPQFQTLNLQATLTCEALVNLMSYMI